MDYSETTTRIWRETLTECDIEKILRDWMRQQRSYSVDGTLAIDVRLEVSQCVTAYIKAVETIEGQASRALIANVDACDAGGGEPPEACSRFPGCGCAPSM